MKSIDISATNWQQFLSIVYKKIQELKQSKCEVPYFRGQRKIIQEYPLVPKIFRDKYLDKYKSNKYLEYDMYFDFVTKGGRQISKNSTWHNLFLMQHYGLPTRLLDWSDNFAVALFFALKNYKEDSNDHPEIIILNPFVLNKKTFELDDQTGELINPELSRNIPRYIDLIDQDFKFDRYEYPIALYPFRFNTRLIAQGGYFTFHGQNIKAIEELVPESIFKFQIPIDTIFEAKKFLDLGGVNEYSIYNDLESLSSYLERFFFD